MSENDEKKASGDDVDHVAVGIGVIGGHDIGEAPTESGSAGADDVSEVRVHSSATVGVGSV